ncbi:uncharacterized protein EV420DRAFT_1743891 [Desarmillaria tabescens]|uniref:BTB domain-containing protein n=1 Tax=Armillaria tabescens TaxID=1929756 RepID=A0AA39NID8_ARMTA|nr:uncharacterized protein EV420DRAFT_1743891 [Desarmillaria tabescens]KAK0466013.1 hypothetical protein EV420DRAFT_1743891 [Desarmillaria tabescens]
MPLQMPSCKLSSYVSPDVDSKGFTSPLALEILSQWALSQDLLIAEVGTQQVNPSQWHKHPTRHEETSRHLLTAYHHQQMDTEIQPSLITTTDAPFNDPADNVDLVIRTADNVDFFVLSILLSLRSPSSFFRQVFQGGNKHTEERDGLPVLEVTEDSDTFRTILLFCYPCAAPEFKSVQKFLAVGVALEKYCMERAMERFIQAVLASSVISEQPLRVFALAVANGWKAIGEAAARNTLAMPLNYHTRCGKAAQIQPEKGLQHQWITREISSLLFLQRSYSCPWCNNRRLNEVMRNNGRAIYAHSWLTGTYLRLVDAKVLLEPQVALDDHIIDQAVFASTKECNSSMHDKWTSIAGSQIRLLGKIVAEEIGRRISEVPLNIEW